MKKNNPKLEFYRRKYALKKLQRTQKKTKKTKKIKNSNIEVVYLPEYLKVYANNKGLYRRETISCFYKIRKYINKNINININFKHVSTLFPCGALILYSIIDRALSKGHKVTLSGYAKNNRTHQVLQQIKLLDLVYENPPQINIDRNDVECWHMQPIEYDNSDKGALTKAFLAAAVEVKNTRALKGSVAKKLFGGISEAVINMHEHAYCQYKSKPSIMGWILWSYRDSHFSIWAYDDGVGIPTSLKTSSNHREKLVQLVSLKDNDTAWIKEAIKMKRTSTNQKNRGKGLPQIIDSALKNDGSVTIISNRGQHTEFSNKSGIVSLPSLKKKYLMKPSPGTLITWEFKP